MMMFWNARHEQSSTIRALRAAVLLLLLLGVGHSIATQRESAVSAAQQTAAPDRQAPARTPYFPAQYVNQAQEVEEHIQAF